MRILIVKISSMGDVIHTLPAITDVHKHYPNAIIDWVVEEGFVEIPKVHTAVNKVITVAARRWRKNLTNKDTQAEIKKFIADLREYQYDYVIDAQGLLKSAVIAKLARLSNKGARHGLDSKSARGKYISWFYKYCYNVSTDLHAIYRVKLLFSKIFQYSYNKDLLDYGLDYHKVNPGSKAKVTELALAGDPSLAAAETKPYLVFLHCTTWDSKKWPAEYWRQLIQQAIDNGFTVKLNSGNPQELADAMLLAHGFDSSKVCVMPPQSIRQLMVIIANSQGVVCVDTGLGHLAAALDKPGVGIFGSTSPKLTSILSNRFINISSDFVCSPCFLRNCDKPVIANTSYPPCYYNLTPHKIWQALLVNMPLKMTCESAETTF